MNITPSQSTLQAFGSLHATDVPAHQARQPVAAEPIEPPAANATQRVDAAPRIEAPVRPDVDNRPPPEDTDQRARPGSRVDLLV